jgi:nicotinate-nucleotide pyrophosphorylase (carboxylating)
MSVERGMVLATIEGPARSLLTAERLMLNFLGRLSGIATLTQKFVQAVAGTKARIYDTRKTAPGWRRLEKYAVRQGGACNHRTGLFDAILIKDNHLAFGAGEQWSVVSGQWAVVTKDKGLGAKDTAPHSNPLLRGEGVIQFSPAQAVRHVRQFIGTNFPTDDPRREMVVEVEVDSLAQLEQVLPERPDIVLLDNMSLEELRRAVEMRNALAANVQLEASGGVSLATVRSIAETGVDRISAGALTHSAISLDVALDWAI